MKNLRLKLGLRIMDLGMSIIPPCDDKDLLQASVNAVIEYKLYRFLSKKQ